jgi:hypothetical protein
MSFPWSISGTIAVPGLAPEESLARIESALASQGAKQVERDGTVVRFRAGVFRWVGRSNILAPVAHGEVEAAAAQGGAMLRYELRLSQMVMVNGAMALVAGLLVTWSKSGVSLVRGFAVFGFLWLVLVIGNFATTQARFPGFLSRALSHSSG